MGLEKEIKKEKGEMSCKGGGWVSEAMAYPLEDAQTS